MKCSLGSVKEFVKAVQMSFELSMSFVSELKPLVTAG
jgi:hypothetical protein